MQLWTHYPAGSVLVKNEPMATDKQVISYSEEKHDKTLLFIGNRIKVVKIGHQFHLKAGYIMGYTPINQYRLELDYEGKAGKNTVTLPSKLCKLQEFKYRAKPTPE